MQKGVCAAYARRGIAQGLLIGPVCLTAGIGLAVLTGVFSGPPLRPAASRPTSSAGWYTGKISPEKAAAPPQRRRAAAIEIL